MAMFVRAVLSSTPPRSPPWVASSLTRPVTLTSSVIAPTSSATVPAENLSFALTCTLVRSSVLKPCMLTLSA